MKISIVTPSYNQGQFIERAIVSVLAQDYKDFEHIIYDAGSTDGTIEILKKYPHLIWVSEADRGQSHALNKGFARAVGDVVGWLNTDEFYYPGTFDRVAHAFEHGKMDVLYGDYVESRSGVQRAVRGISHVRGLLNWHHYINTLTVFIKKDVFESGLFIDESFEAAMDKEFFLRLERAGFVFSYLPHYFGEFLWHADNKSTKIRALQRAESFQIIKKYFFFNNGQMAKAFFWPVKILYAFFYKVMRVLQS